MPVRRTPISIEFSPKPSSPLTKIDVTPQSTPAKMTSSADIFGFIFLFIYNTVPFCNLLVFVVIIFGNFFNYLDKRRQFIRVIFGSEFNFKQCLVLPEGEYVNFKILIFIDVKPACFVKHLPVFDCRLIFAFGDVIFDFGAYQF